jgi:hypothetical protein
LVYIASGDIWVNRYYPGDNPTSSVKGRYWLRHQSSAEKMVSEGFSLLVEGWCFFLRNLFPPITLSAVWLYKCIFSRIKTLTIKSTKLAREIKQILKGSLLKVVYTGPAWIRWNWHNIRFGSCGVSKVCFGIIKHLGPGKEVDIQNYQATKVIFPREITIYGLIILDIHLLTRSQVYIIHLYGCHYVIM